MWNYGIKYGKGIYNWTSGENYDGEWKDDKMNGHGVFMFADKTVLEGEFINNEVKFYNYKLLKFLLGLIWQILLKKISFHNFLLIYMKIKLVLL